MELCTCTPYIPLEFHDVTSPCAATSRFLCSAFSTCDFEQQTEWYPRMKDEPLSTGLESLAVRSVTNDGFEETGFQQPFFIVSWVEFGLSLVLFHIRWYTCQKILHRTGNDFYVASATLVRNHPIFPIVHSLISICQLGGGNREHGHAHRRSCSWAWSSSVTFNPGRYPFCAFVRLGQSGACPRGHRPFENCYRRLPPTNRRLPHTDENIFLMVHCWE